MGGHDQTTCKRKKRDGTHDKAENDTINKFYESFLSTHHNKDVNDELREEIFASLEVQRSMMADNTRNQQIRKNLYDLKANFQLQIAFGELQGLEFKSVESDGDAFKDVKTITLTHVSTRVVKVNGLPIGEKQCQSIQEHIGEHGPYWEVIFNGQYSNGSYYFRLKPKDNVNPDPVDRTRLAKLMTPLKDWVEGNPFNDPAEPWRPELPKDKKQKAHTKKTRCGLCHGRFSGYELAVDKDRVMLGLTPCVVEVRMDTFLGFPLSGRHFCTQCRHATCNSCGEHKGGLFGIGKKWVCNQCSTNDDAA